jgi:dihydrofolate reductase
MIRFIVAIDDKNGIANDKGIPWNLPADKQYYRDKIKDGVILMGYNTYAELSHPMSDKINYVATRDLSPLKFGFEPITDPAKLLDEINTDVWVIGGAKIFESLLSYADELYITKIDGDYDCTKFFPDYTKDFELVSETEQKTDNSINFKFTVYKKK